MRMWMVDPRILCRKHLLGAHVETHMFVGTLKKQISVLGYLRDNLLEPHSILLEHNRLAAELVRRKYRHHTPLTYDVSILNYLNESINVKIDRQSSFNELIRRCSLCRQRYEYLKNLEIVNK